MVKVLKTNSGFFLAFKDDITLSDAEISQYKQSQYFDTKLSQPFEFHKQFGKADYDITKRLLKELSLENPVQTTKINELENINAFRQQVLDMARKSGTQPVMAEYEIKTADLPQEESFCLFLAFLYIKKAHLIDEPFLYAFYQVFSKAFAASIG